MRGQGKIDPENESMSTLVKVKSKVTVVCHPCNASVNFVLIHIHRPMFAPLEPGLLKCRMPQKNIASPSSALRAPSAAKCCACSGSGNSPRPWSWLWPPDAPPVSKSLMATDSITVEEVNVRRPQKISMSPFSPPAGISPASMPRCLSRRARWSLIIPALSGWIPTCRW